MIASRFPAYICALALVLMKALRSAWYRMRTAVASILQVNDGDAFEVNPGS